MSAPAQPDTQPGDAQITALVAAQSAAVARLTAQATALATASTRSFTGWYDAAAITVWAGLTAQRVEAVQRLIAQLTDAYLARVLTVMTGRTVRPLGAVDVAALRGGVTHAGAYARAADQYRWQQHQFDAFSIDLAKAESPQFLELATPLDAAVQRAAGVADTDAQLALRGQSQAVMTAAAERGVITGYRRVIHPEASRGGVCGLCVAASDRLYSAHEPMPIHTKCHCTTLPVRDSNDPGSRLNAADLSRLYGDAGDTSRERLKATRYRIDEHGELGLVLAPKNQPIRTARQAARDVNRARAVKTDAERLADVRRIRADVAAALPRARQLATDDPKWRDYLQRLEARIGDLDHQLAA